MDSEYIWTAFPIALLRTASFIDGRERQRKAKMPSSMFVLLPPELFDIIARHCAKKELKNLRLVHRQFSKLCERRLFSSVTLESHSKLSHLNCQAFQESSLNPYVRKFTVITCPQPDLPRHRFHELIPTPDKNESYSPPSYQGWLRSIREVGKFVNLEAVKVHFSCDVAAVDDDGESWMLHDWQPRETPSWRSSVLEALICGLEHVEFPTPNLKSLTIKNLQNINHKRIVESKKFKTLLGRIEELRLLIVHEEDDSDPRYTFEREELHRFFKELPGTWLARCKSLKRLTIHSQCNWGYYPKVDWRGLDLPNLTFLQLGKYSFAQEWQIDWICGMKGLRGLVLDSCHIISKSEADDMDEEGFVKRPTSNRNQGLWVDPRRWRHHFSKLGEQLPNLSEVRFGYDYWTEGQNFEEDLGDVDEERANRAAYNREYAYNYGPEFGLYKPRYMRFYWEGYPTPWRKFSWNPEDDDYATEREERLDRQALKNLQKLAQQRALGPKWAISTTSEDWKDEWRSDSECPESQSDVEETEDWTSMIQPAELV